jgi:hypothetical protein
MCHAVDPPGLAVDGSAEAALYPVWDHLKSKDVKVPIKREDLVDAITKHDGGAKRLVMTYSMVAVFCDHGASASLVSQIEIENREIVAKRIEAIQPERHI